MNWLRCELARDLAPLLSQEDRGRAGYVLETPVERWVMVTREGSSLAHRIKDTRRDLPDPEEVRRLTDEVTAMLHALKRRRVKNSKSVEGHRCYQPVTTSSKSAAERCAATVMPSATSIRPGGLECEDRERHHALLASGSTSARRSTAVSTSATMPTRKAR